MYKLDIFRFPKSIEYEYKFNGNYGARGEKRNPKQKRTPEDIKRQNQYQRSKKVRHLIKANFGEGDYWITLTYAPTVKSEKISKPIQSISKDLENFLGSLRREYKKQEIPCKYISRIEIGSRGGIHVHIILNRINDLDLLMQKKWKHGRVHHELLDDGTYEELAEYIVKPPTRQQKRLLRALADSEDVKKLIRYSCSRNLTRPEPERREYSQRTMRSIFNHDLVPSEGFYIDKNSVRRGTNKFTGMGYLYYQEVKISPKVRIKAEPVRLCECPICHQFTIDSMQCDCMRKRGRRGSRKIQGQSIH